MFTSNPFAELAVFLSPLVMQVYAVLMILAVVLGTLIDVAHKKSAQYFLENWRDAKSKAPTQVGGAKIVSLAVQTFLLDVLTSAELKDCSARRRVAHLLIMYGFVAYVIATIVMVFGYPTPATATPTIWPFLWHIGALLVCVGGYWFWFFLRVDVLAEGYSPFRVVRADLFILSMLASATLALLWSLLQATGVGWLAVLRFVRNRHDGAVRIRSLVQVRPHVLQARCGLAETGSRSGGFEEQSAGPGRQTRNLRPCARRAAELLTRTSNTLTRR